MTKTSTPIEQSKKQRDNIKTPPKTLNTQLLRTDLGRSVGVKAVTQLVWLNRFTSAQRGDEDQDLVDSEEVWTRPVISSHRLDSQSAML